MPLQFTLKIKHIGKKRMSKEVYTYGDPSLQFMMTRMGFTTLMDYVGMRVAFHMGQSRVKSVRVYRKKVDYKD